MVGDRQEILVAFGGVAAVALALWAGTSLRRRRQQRRLLAESVEAMLAELRSGRPTPVLRLLADLSTVLFDQIAAAARIERAAHEALPSSGRGMAGLDEAVLGLVEVAQPESLVAAFVAEHLDATQRVTAAEHLGPTTRTVARWQPDDAPVTAAQRLAGESVAEAAVSLLQSLAGGSDRPAPLPADGMDDERRSYRVVLSAMPRLDQVSELPPACERLYLALAQHLRLARVTVLAARQSGYADPVDDLTAAFERCAQELESARGLLAESAPVAALRLLVAVRLPVPEHGVPGEATRVALLDQVPWLQYIAAAHRSAMLAWAGALIDAAQIEGAQAVVAVERKEFGIG